MIFVFTGNGKGKTTSAIGQAIRVLGQGGKAIIIQFIKSEKFKTGEEKAIAKFGSRFKFVKGGSGYVGIRGDKFPIQIHKKAAEKTLKLAEKAILSKEYNLIILDEINVALSLKLVSLKEVVVVVKKAKSVDLILTGRGAPKELIKIADLATEFKEIKHPFKNGIFGKQGREY